MKKYIFLSLFIVVSFVIKGQAKEKKKKTKTHYRTKNNKSKRGSSRNFGKTTPSGAKIIGNTKTKSAKLSSRLMSGSSRNNKHGTKD